MELISKYDVIKALQKWNCRDYESLTINPYEVLRDIPTIEERNKGEWINDTRYSGWTCTHCHYHDGNRTDNYCPNCGAKMIGVDAIKYYVDNTPTIDLVRCKDCKYVMMLRSESSAKEFGQIYECRNGVFNCPKPNDFCSRAERRSDDHI